MRGGILFVILAPDFVYRPAVDYAKLWHNLALGYPVQVIQSR